MFSALFTTQSHSLRFNSFRFSNRPSTPKAAFLSSTRSTENVSQWREKRRAFSKSGYTVRWAVVTTLFHSLPFLIDSNTCEQAPKPLLSSIFHENSSLGGTTQFKRWFNVRAVIHRRVLSISSASRSPLLRRNNFTCDEHFLAASLEFL